MLLAAAVATAAADVTAVAEATVAAAPAVATAAATAGVVEDNVVYMSYIADKLQCGISLSVDDNILQTQWQNIQMI